MSMNPAPPRTDRQPWARAAPLALALALPALGLAQPAATLETSCRDTSFTGVVIPQKQVDIKAPAAARVAAESAHVGDHVKEGAILVQLDVRRFKLALQQAKAALATEEAAIQEAANLEEKAKDHRRRMRQASRLFSKEELAAADLDVKVAEAHLQAARAQADAATVQVRKARTRLHGATIRAPFSGSIAARFTDAGAMVAANEPLMRIVSYRDVLIRFAVPPSAEARYSVGDEVTVTTGEHGTTLPARILRIAPEIDRPTQLIFIEAAFEKRLPLPVRPGTPVAVRSSPTSRGCTSTTSGKPTLTRP